MVKENLENYGSSLHHSLVIGINVSFALIFLLIGVFVFYNLWKLRKKKIKDLLESQVINQKRLIINSITAGIITLVMWILVNVLIALTFKAQDWANHFTIIDVLKTCTTCLVGVLGALIIGSAGLHCLKLMKTVETSKIVRIKATIMRSVIATGIVACSGLMIHTGLSIASWVSNNDSSKNWNYYAKEITNLVIGIFGIISVVFLVWNAFKFTNANTDLEKVQTKRAIVINFVVTASIFGTMFLGNFLIDILRIFNSEVDSTWHDKALLFLNYLTGLGIYICIINLIFAIASFAYAGSNESKLFKSKLRLKNVILATIVLLFLILGGNLIIEMVKASMLFQSGQLHLNNYLFKLANLIIGFCAFLILCSIGFNAICLSMTNNATATELEFGEYKRRVVVSIWCFLFCLGMFAIVNTIIGIATIFI